jgi:predicted RNA-binding Zn-ribbon protein involved in translation (DUF1610 family)
MNMTTGANNKNFSKFIASSLFCPRCGKAQAVISKLLLCLPDSDKYAYYCKECGAELGARMEKN